MKLASSIALLLFTCAVANAEQVQFKVVDLLWLQHPSRGEGVEIVYQFDRKPSDGDDALEAFALSECNRVAPKYVPVALEKLGKDKTDFVAINFRFGGVLGTYIKFFADYDNGVCTNIE